MLDRLTSSFRKLANVRKTGLIARCATRLDYRANRAELNKKLHERSIKNDDISIVEKLEKVGIVIIPDFWTSEKCDQARLEIDRLIVEYPVYVNKNAKADQRIYGANNASALIDSFGSDPRLGSIATEFNRSDTINAFTLAARMPASSGNLGSGEGWHRDAFFRQFKAIMYLSDVGLENGPFQLLEHSQQPGQIIKDMKRANLAYMQYRVEEQQIARLVRQDPQRLRTFTAKAGTLILVDTSTLHRGMPIQTGTRYALTNYYFPIDAVDHSMYEKFDVLPKA
ncbi:phytanoyl-CoA dioxygenase family protein [Herbaspirillum sp. GW103]|uniref:phytanoyl-CoA dioxygenase family protein n=1 Tax=Herbaspirillum sp. GW103 TaxID=1175306 RepID=UPI00055000B3|nr:phytanoyl-CoA dioxygenase family protein [Herbaspirillum sp. GW103]